MASFAHFVGVRRSCRALQFILTATEAAIATQKPNGKPVSALTTTRQASFCQHGRSLPSPPEISAFYSRLNHAFMHPLTCVKYGAAALALGPAHSVTVPRGVLCSCTDLERTASCIASAGHAWAVPVSDMRGALRALYEVTIMPVFIAVYT